MRIRLFIMFMLIFLLPLMLLAICGETWVSENIIRNAESSFNSIMENVASRVDTDIASLQNVASLVAADNTVRKLANMSGSEIDYSRISMSALQDYRNQLAFHCENSRLYSEAAACFPKKNFVLSTLGLWKLEWFLRTEFNIEFLSTADALELLNTGGMLYDCTVSRFNASDRGLVCVLPAIKRTSGECLMSMIFFIEDDVLNAYLDDLTLFPGAVAILTDAEGRQISAYSSQSDADAEAFSAYSGGDTYAAGDGSYRVMRYVSSQQKWQYTVFLPEDSLYSEVNAFRSMVHILFVIMLLVGLVLSLELSRINYRPFEQFFQLLNLHHPSSLHSSASQIQEAETALMAIIDEKNMLNERLRANSPMVRYAALIHLLEGSSDAAHLLEDGTLALLGLSMEAEYFAIAILCGGQSASPVLEFSASDARCFVLDYHSELVAIINYGAPGELESIVQQLSALAERVCLSSLNFTRMTDLPAAYRQAGIMRSQLPIRTSEKVFYYSEQSTTRQSIQYQNDIENRVLAAVRAGNSGQAYGEILRLLEASDQSLLSPSAVRKLVLTAETSVAKSDPQGALAEQLNALPLPEDLPDSQLAHLREVLDAAAAFYLARSERMQSERTEQIVSFIEEHLCDEQLSLSMVAEAFGMTTTYLSRYFKEQLDTNYLDFVSRKRIELAKQLLRQDAGTIHEIAQRVGFSSDATFRRQYKKYEGVAPSSDIPAAPMKADGAPEDKS